MVDSKNPTVSLANDEADEHSREKRRSRRVQITIPVIVRGKIGSKIFEEKSITAAVGAHGCMLQLVAKLYRGEQIMIVNIVTLDERVCRVSFLGPSDGDHTKTGLEFLNPSPQFWRMHFPPDNWHPADRKLPSSVPPLTSHRHD
jgi:hypothetical protein